MQPLCQYHQEAAEHARATNMLVRQYVSLELKLNFPHSLAAIVDNMHVDVYVCTADPDLAM